MPAAVGDRSRGRGRDRPVYSKRSTPAEFARLLEASLESIRGTATTDTAIFRGFSADELRNILDRGYILDCPAGIKLIGRGQRTRTVFVVLSGRLEAHLDDRRRPQGPGDILGEIAYLTGGTRTADVWVTEDHTRVLCLNDRTMQALSEGEPALAARFLGNLSRVLARRMADRGRPVEVPDEG